MRMLQEIFWKYWYYIILDITIHTDRWQCFRKFLPLEVQIVLRWKEENIFCFKAKYVTLDLINRYGFEWCRKYFAIMLRNNLLHLLTDKKNNCKWRKIFPATFVCNSIHKILLKSRVNNFLQHSKISMEIMQEIFSTYINNPW